MITFTHPMTATENVSAGSYTLPLPMQDISRLGRVCYIERSLLDQTQPGTAYTLADAARNAGQYGLRGYIEAYGLADEFASARAAAAAGPPEVMLTMQDAIVQTAAEARWQLKVPTKNLSLNLSAALITELNAARIVVEQANQEFPTPLRPAGTPATELTAGDIMRGFVRRGLKGYEQDVLPAPERQTARAEYAQLLRDLLPDVDMGGTQDLLPSGVVIGRTADGRIFHHYYGNRGEI